MLTYLVHVGHIHSQCCRSSSSWWQSECVHCVCAYVSNMFMCASVHCIHCYLYNAIREPQTVYLNNEYSRYLLFKYSVKWGYIDYPWECTTISLNICVHAWGCVCEPYVHFHAWGCVCMSGYVCQCHVCLRAWGCVCMSGYVCQCHVCLRAWGCVCMSGYVCVPVYVMCIQW